MTEKRCDTCKYGEKLTFVRVARWFCHGFEIGTKGEAIYPTWADYSCHLWEQRSER